MITAGSYAATDSANATLVACTTAGFFLGAAIAGGDGTLTIKAGTATMVRLKTTANLDSVSLIPPVPIAVSTGLNATNSGTGSCVVFYAKAV